MRTRVGEVLNRWPGCGAEAASTPQASASAPAGGVEAVSRHRLDEGRWQAFARGLSYVSAPLDDPDAFGPLRERAWCGEVGRPRPDHGRRVRRHRAARPPLRGAMEPPDSLAPEDVCDRKAELIETVRPFSADDLVKGPVRSRRGRGTRGARVPGRGTRGARVDRRDVRGSAGLDRQRALECRQARDARASNSGRPDSRRTIATSVARCGRRGAPKRRPGSSGLGRSLLRSRSSLRSCTHRSCGIDRMRGGCGRA
jgi:hypothetical protein